MNRWHVGVQMLTVWGAVIGPRMLAGNIRSATR